MVNFYNFVIASCRRGPTPTTITLCHFLSSLLPILISVSSLLSVFSLSFSKSSLVRRSRGYREPRILFPSSSSFFLTLFLALQRRDNIRVAQERASVRDKLFRDVCVCVYVRERERERERERVLLHARIGTGRRTLTVRPK